MILLNLGLSLLALAFAWAILEIDRNCLPPLPGFLSWFAWPFFIVGTVMILSAAIILARRSGATGAPGDLTQTLVRQGIYAWIRNPIYAGDILLLFGISFFTRSTLFYLAAIGVLFLLNAYVRRIEEPRTERRLGEAYRVYLREVPRWFPSLRKRLYKK